jgi:hypothetical protein
MTFAEHAMLARARADSFRWLAEREPTRRTLTVEECYILAAEAEAFANALDHAASATKERAPA